MVVMKQKIDIDAMTSEPLLQSDQVTVEASTALQRGLAGALACTAVALSLPGGVGVPSIRSESVTVTLESEEGGKDPRIPSPRRGDVFTPTFMRRH